MMDYDLGLFEAAAAVPVPFFRTAHKVTAVRLGETFAPPVLDGRSEESCSAYCSVTLPAGDYKISVGLSREDGRKSNISGFIQTLDSEGMLVDKVGHIGVIDTRTTRAYVLALSEEQSLIFRVKAEQRLKATLKVEPMESK